MLRFVLIAPFAFYPLGTVHVRIMPIAKWLHMRGHEVSIILPPYDNLSESGREYRVDSINIVNIKIPSVFSPLKQLLSAWRLVKKVVSAHPDVVHIFKPVGYGALGGMFLLILRRLGLFKAVIILDTDDWEGKGGFYTQFLSRRLYPRYQLEFYRFQNSWVPRHVDAVTAASRTLQSLISEMGVPSSRIYYLPNGTYGLEPPPVTESQAAILKEKLGISGKPVILLYTRFFEFGIKQVADILQNLREEAPDARLLVVGKGRFGEENDLLNLVKERGISDMVVFTGWIEPDKVYEYLMLADVAIYPFDDNLLNRTKCPGKLVEMMNLGICVIANKVGQIAEYIEDGKSGILVEPGDTQGFADGIIRLLKDERLRNETGANARKRIRTNFNWEKLLAVLEDVYGNKGEV